MAGFFKLVSGLGTLLLAGFAVVLVLSALTGIGIVAVTSISGGVLGH